MASEKAIIHTHTHTQTQIKGKTEMDSTVQSIYRYSNEIKAVRKYQDANFLRWQKLSREFSELLSLF